MSGFILVAIVAAIIGGVGIFYIKKIDAADTKLYEKLTVPLGELAAMSSDFQRIRVNIRDFIVTTNRKRWVKLPTLSPWVT